MNNGTGVLPKKETLNNETITIRLACIDAPEMAQTPWGQQSADRLKQLLPAGQAVQVREIERKFQPTSLN
jgi:micrococcal nuclease